MVVAVNRWPCTAIRVQHAETRAHHRDIDDRRAAGDTVDGNDGFANRQWLIGWAQPLSAITNQEFDRQDGSSFVEDLWFCARNTTSGTVSATLTIKVQLRQFVPGVGWTVTVTGDRGYHVEGLAGGWRHRVRARLRCVAPAASAAARARF